MQLDHRSASRGNIRSVGLVSSVSGSPTQEDSPWGKHNTTIVLENLAQQTLLRIDALGLVTVFGAEKINRSIGTLVQSSVTEYPPGLGVHIVASNQITDPIPGFVLYNITDGILAKAIDDHRSAPGEDVKVLLTLPDSRAVTVPGPRQVVVDCLMDPRPPHPRFYRAFGAHVIARHEYAVLLDPVRRPTAGYLSDGHSRRRPPGDHRHAVAAGRRLRRPLLARSPAYVRLGLTETEEDCMAHWNLHPRRTNTVWWDKYRTNHGRLSCWRDSLRWSRRRGNRR
ncbi:hypothetical protein DL769_008713 [Monosporascus sp. CRB-8-3]|nr:hypothetical protein DL769_008713 [Monosporascus sp. CRB-8-3]